MLLLELQVNVRSIQHSDYITRKNPEEVIDENDMKKLINQVYKLVMLLEKIIHVLPQNLRLTVKQKLKSQLECMEGNLEANFHVVVRQFFNKKYR